MKKFLKKARILVFIVVFCCCIFDNRRLNTYAYNETNYEEAGLNFLTEQYEIKNFAYNNLYVYDSVDLFDVNDNKIAECLIVDRDGQLDYVVLDFSLDKIDEFGYNQNELMQKFISADKIYYDGAMDYAVKVNGEFRDLDGNYINQNNFAGVTNTTANESFNNSNNPYGAFYSWKNISETNAGYENSAYNYLRGFNFSGISDDGLSFKSQTNYNNQYNTTHSNRVDGTCGAVAVTDIFVYFQWRKIANKNGTVNALLNGSDYDTFERMIELTKWTSDGVTLGNAKSALKSFAEEQNYNFDMDTYFWGTNWNKFISSINQGRPVLTEIQSTNSDGDFWGHLIMTVGYEQFTHTYSVNQRYWFFGWHDKWVTQSDDYHYLRVVDGWSTSNSSRFIDYNGFWDECNGTDFIIYS